MKLGKVAIILAPVLIILAFILVQRSIINEGEDTWLCQNGIWVKHGNPATPKPTELCYPPLEKYVQNQIENINLPSEATESTQDVLSQNFQRMSVEEIGMVINIPNGYYFNKEQAMNLTTNKPYGVSFTIQNYKGSPNETQNPYQLYGIYQWDTENISDETFKKADFIINENTKTEFEVDGQLAVKGMIKGERSRYSINILINGYILKLAASGEESFSKSITDKIVDSIEFK